MCAKKTIISRKKVKLSDLLGKEGKTNADLYQNQPEKRAKHLLHRTPRNRLMIPKGAEYNRPLHSDPARDLKYNMVALEFLSNGFRQTKAYAAVYGLSLKSANPPASKLFGSTWFRAKLALMMLGTDGKISDLPKEYLLDKTLNILEMNILDFIGDDGMWLTVPELRKLPLELQQMLDNFTLVNTVRHVALRDIGGEIVMNEDDTPYMVEVRDQKVFLKMPDRLKSMELLAKLMDWITSHVDHTLFLDASVMQMAETRIKALRRQDIGQELEGEATRLTAD